MIDPAVLAALIAAIASLLVAILSFYTTKKNQNDLSKLQEQNAEKDARRDYEYEARKRLYQEYEPLLFQLVECSQTALHRIYNIARLAHKGTLLDKDGLGCNIYEIAKQSSLGKMGSYKDEGLAYDTYYATATIYYLLAPLVIVKLIQRLLTFVDLSLDRSINEQYILAKLLYKTFNDDFNLAGITPALLYDPDNAELTTKCKTKPQIYWRQGVVAGELEIAVGAMIISDTDNKVSDNNVLRCMSFGEFEDTFYKPNSDFHEKMSSFTNLFFNFHPKTRPVLWRILVTQALIYKALLYTHQLKLSGSRGSSQKSLENILLRPIPQPERLDFDWRQTTEEASDKEVLNQPFETAQAYLDDYVQRFKLNVF